MKLVVNNFGALSGTHTFEFSDKINALVGPNGCGKSTVVGALFFAITGESLTRANLDALISWGCPSMTVQFISDYLTITRTVTVGKPQKAVLEYPGRKETITRQEEINDAVLKSFNIIDKAAFRQVFFAEQFKAIDILDAGNAKRLELLAALLGLTKFEKFRSSIASTAPLIFTSHVGQALIDNLSERMTTANRAVKEAEKELSTIKVFEPEEENTLKQACLMMPVEEFRETSEKISVLERELEGVKAQLESLPEPPNADDVEVYNKAKRLAELKTELASIAAKEKKALKSVTPSSDKIRALMDRVVSKGVSIDTRKTEVLKRLDLIKEGKCPITGGEPCSDLIKYSDPEAVKAEVASLEKEKEESQKDLAELNEALRLALSKESEQALVLAEARKIRDQIESLAAYASVDVDALGERISKLSENKEQREALIARTAQITSEIKIYMTRIEGLEEKSLPTKADQEAAALLIQENADKARRKLQLETEINSLNREKKQVEESMKLADEQNERATKGEEAVSFLSDVRAVLHKDQLPALLVSKLRNSLNKRLAVYLGLFEFPYTARWTADGGIVYTTVYGEDLPASSLSGGQKYMLAVANRCALADTLGAKFPLMVLDEPTTGLDDVNKGKMSQLLQKVSETLSGKGVYLVIPTHDEELLVNANVIKVNEN